MRSVLITGVSSGIGRATALHFAGRGWRVFGGVRKLGDAPDHPALVPLELDVTSDSSVESACRAMEREAGGILHGLINNAGTNLVGAFEYTSIGQAKELMELNLWGPVRLTRRLLPLVRRSSTGGWTGKIVTVGSIGSVASVPWMAHYHGSKFGILGVMEALRHEVHSQGVKVSVVCPGGVRTSFQKRTEERMTEAMADLGEDAPPQYRSSFAKFARIIAASGERGSEPESVARALHNLVMSRNPRFKAVVGADARLIHILKRCLPEAAFLSIYRRLFTE